MTKESQGPINLLSVSKLRIFVFNEHEEDLKLARRISSYLSRWRDARKLSGQFSHTTDLHLRPKIKVALKSLQTKPCFSIVAPLGTSFLTIHHIDSQKRSKFALNLRIMFLDCFRTIFWCKTNIAQIGAIPQ